MRAFDIFVDWLVGFRWCKTMKKPVLLIVEDWESQLFLLRGFLAREGYLVGEAKNGIDAIRHVRDGYCDVVLLDYKMPGINGIEVLKEIKAIKPVIDVVIISAYGTTERAVEALDAGAYSYITKPVDLDKILLLLDRISKRRFPLNGADTR